ncbi:MAG: response regulator [Eubacteriaceae bacterium]|nr:response regulator [Eubacteriaceae bacterium]
MFRILIVDDEKSIRLTLKEFLLHEGHLAEAVDDARKALSLLQETSFDLVITDIIMPGMSGIELAKKIHQESPNTQIIIMTGEPTVDTAVNAVRSGAVDYLSKPISKDIFLYTVNKTLLIKTRIDEKERVDKEKKKYQDTLQQLVNDRTSDLKKMMQNMVILMSSVVEMRDPYTAGHQRRVGNLAADIGTKLGLNQKDVDLVRIIGYIHDIGKIVIPSEILSKPGRLNTPEMEMIKLHSAQGYEVISKVELPSVISETVYQHHERLDGSGYPRGLTEDQITKEAKILIVADVVEAMMSHRPYRPALGIDVALEEIKRNSGKLYSPEVVEACIELFKNPNYSIDESKIEVNFSLLT